MYSVVSQVIDKDTGFPQQTWLACFDRQEHTKDHIGSRNWIWKASTKIKWNLSMNVVAAQQQNLKPANLPPRPGGKKPDNNKIPGTNNTTTSL